VNYVATTVAARTSGVDAADIVRREEHTLPAPVGGMSMETILVGVDGSDQSQEALARAATEAALHKARLRIVCAWEVPSVVFAGGYVPGAEQSVFEGFRERAEAIVTEAVAEAKRLQPAVPCDGEALQGQPANVLLECASDASLVVVGSRGRGGFASLLLGSTSQQVVHHAPCPVLVVHAREGGRDE
jgi:nucleotide-binding universal stress UspA family protein